jgi:hypothetical protein
MKDKAKEAFRFKIYQLIEVMKNKLPDLKIETNQPSISQDFVDGIGYVERMTGGPDYDHIWEWNYCLDSNDQNVVDFVNALSELDSSLNSKEGARFLPRGMCRSLLEFNDICISYKPMDSSSKKILMGFSSKPSAEQILEKTKKIMKLDEFNEAIRKIVKEIVLFENEKDESEESFFGEA